MSGGGELTLSVSRFPASNTNKLCEIALNTGNILYL